MNNQSKEKLKDSNNKINLQMKKISDLNEEISQKLL